MSCGANRTQPGDLIWRPKNGGKSVTVHPQGDTEALRLFRELGRFFFILIYLGRASYILRIIVIFSLLSSKFVFLHRYRSLFLYLILLSPSVPPHFSPPVLFTFTFFSQRCDKEITQWGP